MSDKKRCVLRVDSSAHLILHLILAIEKNRLPELLFQIADQNRLITNSPQVR
jgi:hypothetical protein